MTIDISKHQFKGKIKKADFETKLFDTLGESSDIGARSHREEGKPMTIYYLDNGHCATWMGGEGWIFANERIEKNIASSKAILKR